jgi:hypothetical protein
VVGSRPRSEVGVEGGIQESSTPRYGGGDNSGLRVEGVYAVGDAVYSYDVLSLAKGFELESRLDGRPVPLALEDDDGNVSKKPLLSLAERVLPGELERTPE